MCDVIINARFADRMQAEKALEQLRRSGALRPCCALGAPGAAGQAALRLAVRAQHSALARDLILRSGGQL